MSGQNQVEQIVKLNPRQYLAAIQSVKTVTRTAFDNVGKSLQDAGNRFDEYSNRVMKNGAGLSGALKNVGKAFADNLGRGAAAGTLGAGALAIKSQMQESIKVGLEFGRSFSHLASRADLSTSRIKALREEIKRLGATGADLGSLPGAVNELYGATGNIDQSMSVMEPISKAASLTDDKDANKIAQFVTERLKGEGREINRGNVESLMQGLLLTERGGEFGNLEGAMAGFGGIDPNLKKRTGLSDRDLAGLLSGTSKAGVNKSTAAAGLQALMRASADEIGDNNIFGGLFGIGSLKTKGKFDIGRLASAHLPGGSDNQKIELLKRTAGVSDQEAAGILAFIKNFDSMNKGIKRTMADTKTLDQAVAESTDNLSDSLGRLRNSVVTGFDDIFGPIEEVAKDLAGGHFKDALKHAPRAIAEAASGVAAHPLLVAGGLASAAGAGLLLKQLGIGGGLGGAVGLAGGLGMGKALQQMGVTPVYVVNAYDIAQGKSGGTTLDRVKDILGTGGVVAAGEGAVGGLGLGAAALLGGGAAVAGGIGYGGGMLLEKSGLLDKQIPGVGGSVNDGVMKLLDKFDEMSSGFLSGKWQDALKVEIDSKDPQFMARPKTSDLNREAK